MYPDDLINDCGNMPRLKWACRRGMLELDVLLGNFLSDVYPALSQKDKQVFICLLNCQDPELFSWLMGSEVPDDPELAAMVTRIREHARSRV